MTLYVLNAEGTDLYKIGVTGEPIRARVASLQTGCPHPLRVVGVFEIPAARGEERRWHDRFGETRTSGEWFRLTEAEVAEILGNYAPAGDALFFVGVTLSGREYVFGCRRSDQCVYAPIRVLPTQEALLLAWASSEIVICPNEGAFIPIDQARTIFAAEPATTWQQMKVDREHLLSRLEAISSVVRDCAVAAMTRAIEEARDA